MPSLLRSAGGAFRTSLGCPLARPAAGPATPPPTECWGYASTEVCLPCRRSWGLCNVDRPPHFARTVLQCAGLISCPSCLCARCRRAGTHPPPPQLPEAGRAFICTIVPAAAVTVGFLREMLRGVKEERAVHLGRHTRPYKTRYMSFDCGQLRRYCTLHASRSPACKAHCSQQLR